jgi:hypothetical protein
MPRKPGTNIFLGPSDRIGFEKKNMKIMGLQSKNMTSISLPRVVSLTIISLYRSSGQSTITWVVAI